MVEDGTENIITKQETEELDILINSLNDEVYLENLKDKNGMAKDKLEEIVEIINEKLDVNWDEARWDEGYWDNVNKENYDYMNYKIY